MPRDIFEAAKRVAIMEDNEIAMFAKHDPDIFRDLAKALLPSIEFFGNCDDCVDGRCTMNCSGASVVIRR